MQKKYLKYDLEEMEEDVVSLDAILSGPRTCLCKWQVSGTLVSTSELQGLLLSQDTAQNLPAA